MRLQPSEKSEKLGTELTHYAELCAIFDRAAIGLALIGADGTLLSANPELHRMLGFEHGELKGMRVRQITYPDDWDEDRELFQQLLDGKRDRYETEKRYVRKDGSLLWGCMSVSLVRDSQDLPQYVTVTVADCTRRKESEHSMRKAERALTASEEHLLRVQTAAKIGAFEWHPHTGDFRWRVEVPSLRGLTEDRCFLEWLAGFHPEDRDRIQQTVQQAVEQRQDFDFNGRIVKPSGEIVWVDSVGLHIPGDDHEHYFGVSTDITERKMAEQALRNLEKLAAKGRLAATIAHEINNPLEALTNLIYLSRQLSCDPRIAEYLELAEQELSRINQIARQTLSFFRDAATPQLVDMTAAVRCMAALYACKAASRDLSVGLELEDGAIVSGLVGELKQVVSNLLVNAMEVAPGKSVIRLRARMTRNWVRISVCDRGAGMPPEVRKHVFEPFFTTKQQSGTGLGLWVSKGIVEKHGGRIFLRSSVAAGRSGTVFSIQLPRAGTVQAAANTASPDHHYAA